MSLQHFLFLFPTEAVQLLQPELPEEATVLPQRVFS